MQPPVELDGLTLDSRDLRLVKDRYARQSWEDLRQNYLSQIGNLTDPQHRSLLQSYIERTQQLEEWEREHNETLDTVVECYQS